MNFKVTHHGSHGVYQVTLPTHRFQNMSSRAMDVSPAAAAAAAPAAPKSPLESASVRDIVARSGELLARIPPLSANTEFSGRVPCAEMLADHLRATADFKAICVDLTLSAELIPYSPNDLITPIDLRVVIERSLLLARSLLRQATANGVSRTTVAVDLWNFITTAIQWSGHDIKHKTVRGAGAMCSKSDTDAPLLHDTVEIVGLLAFIFLMPDAQVVVECREGKRQMHIDFGYGDEFDSRLPNSMYKLASKITRHFDSNVRRTSRLPETEATPDKHTSMSFRVSPGSRFFYSVADCGTVHELDATAAAAPAAAGQPARADAHAASLVRVFADCLAIEAKLAAWHEVLLPHVMRCCYTASDLYEFAARVASFLRRSVSGALLWKATSTVRYCKPRDPKPSHARVVISRVAFLVFLNFIAQRYEIEPPSATEVAQVHFALPNRKEINQRYDLANSFTEISSKIELHFGKDRQFNVKVTYESWLDRARRPATSGSSADDNDSDDAEDNEHERRIPAKKARRN